LGRESKLEESSRTDGLSEGDSQWSSSDESFEPDGYATFRKVFGRSPDPFDFDDYCHASLFEGAPIELVRSKFRAVFDTTLGLSHLDERKWTDADQQDEDNEWDERQREYRATEYENLWSRDDVSTCSNRWDLDLPEEDLDLPIEESKESWVVEKLLEWLKAPGVDYVPDSGLVAWAQLSCVGTPRDEKRILELRGRVQTWVHVNRPDWTPERVNREFIALVPLAYAQNEANIEVMRSLADTATLNSIHAQHKFATAGQLTPSWADRVAGLRRYLPGSVATLPKT
jgi:hypothetical protein